MKNRCMLFFTGNEYLVHVINKQSCKDKQLMIFVRKLVLICLKHNILFKAKHVPGSKNHLADSLSRLQLEKFFQSAPSTMAQSPMEIPHISYCRTGGYSVYFSTIQLANIIDPHL